MKLRLYHHRDGARVAYRESGTGRAIVLLHSLGLTHREWEPVTEALSARFRVVAPDLPRPVLGVTVQRQEIGRAHV